jgi:hypothetical protein
VEVVLALAALLFLSVAAAWFCPMLSGKIIFAGRDLAFYFLPSKYLWVEMAKAGQVPLWNPYNFSGIPLFAALHPGVLYPFHLLFLILPFGVAWNWMIIVHFALAGYSMCALANHLGADRGGSLLAGFTYMLSGYLYSNLTYLILLYAAAWAPLAVLFHSRFQKNGLGRDLVLTSIVLAIQFLSGGLEVLMMTVLILFVLTVFPLQEKGEAGLTGRAKMLTLTGILFLLLSGIQLAPFYELVLNSHRASGLSFKECTTFSFNFKDVLQFFFEDPFHYNATISTYRSGQAYYERLYLGIAPFFLTVLFFISEPSKKRRTVLALLMALSIFLALGRYNPVYPLLFHVPGISSIRYPVKFLFPFFFAVSIASGLGLSHLKELKNKRKLLIYAACCLGGLAGLIPLAFIAHVTDIYSGLARIIIVGLAFALLTTLSLRAAKWNLSWLILVLAAADLFFLQYGTYERLPLDVITRKPDRAYDCLKGDGSSRYYITPPTYDRFVLHLRERASFPPHYAPIHGTHAIEGAEVLTPKHYRLYLDMLINAPSPATAAKLLKNAAAEFIVSSDPLPVDQFPVPPVLVASTSAAGYPVHIYEMKDSAKRFRLCYHARSVGDDNQAFALIWDGKDNSDLLLHGASKADEIKTNGVGRVLSASDFTNRIVVTVETDRVAYLYAADTFFPGWNVYIDDRKGRIMRANIAFRAVKVPEGRHVITFVYRPTSVLFGAILSFLGFGLGAVLWGRSKWRL